MVIQKSRLQDGGWWERVGPDGKPARVDDGRISKELIAAGVETIPEVLKFAKDKLGSKPCLGTRQLQVRHANLINGKMMEKLEFGDYRWMSYTEVYEAAQAVGWSISNLGYKTGDRVAILAETRAEWLIAAIGCLQHRVSVCTVYTTLSDVGLVHALNETEVPLVFASYDLFPRLVSLLPQCPNINTIIVMEDQLEGVGNVTAAPKNVKVIPFQSIAEYDACKIKGDLPKPEVDDIAIIMYTSGSTGTPKGVEITHKNIMHYSTAYSNQIPIGNNARYLAFLPLAHIMEMVTEIALIANGVRIFYSSPTTLTSSSLKILPGTEGDAKIAKPTTMNCVPLVLDRIIKSVTQKVEQQGWVKSFIFKKLVNYKFWIDYLPFTSSFIDFLVFRRVKVELGGELKTLLVGGAPLSPQTQENFKAIFGCTLLVGYGLTETAACLTCMDPQDTRSGHAGAPNVGVLLRLANWEEGGYRNTDKPNPRGEIVVAGNSVTKGYFKRPQETEEAYFMEDGHRWFRTGDIGEMDQFGCLKIIDRKKDLVKMKHGEYVSLGHIESIYKTMPVIDNICIFADSLQDRTVAVIVPTPDILLKLGKEQSSVAVTNPEETNMSHLYTNRQLNKVVLAKMQEHGKQCGLGKWDIPCAVCLTSDSWNPESGLVTAALKLRRRQLTQRYNKQVVALYAAVNQAVAK